MEEAGFHQRCEGPYGNRSMPHREGYLQWVLGG